MDFGLTELQTQIQQLADDLFADLASPTVLAKVDALPQRLDLALWRAVQEAGLDVLALPEVHGGSGLSFFEAALVIEKLGAYTAPIPLIGYTLARSALVQFGHPGQLLGLPNKDTWLSASTGIAGNTLCAAGNTVSGEISAVPYVAGASGLVTIVRTELGTSLALIDPCHASIEWHSQTSTANEPQAHGVLNHTPALIFGGDTAARWLRLHELTAKSVAQLGVVSAALALAREHVCEREQFGVKIGSFQAVSHRLADCFIDVTNLRTTTMVAASRLVVDCGPETELDVLTAQSWAAEAGHRVLASCQHVCGGLGHDVDYPLWRYAVWARHYEIMMGGNEQALEAIGGVIASAPKLAML